MASKRMFSLRIINSTRFLKMPVSARLLYYDLGMRADDDGVVEGFNVLKISGCTEDDLKILVAKDFVKVINDDLVTYITDWKEHNSIRADRKTDSMYKDLLLQMVEDVELIEPRQRADLKPKQVDENKDNGQPMDVQWTDNGQELDSPVSADGRHRIGESRIDKVSIDKEREDLTSHSLELVQYYEKITGNLGGLNLGAVRIAVSQHGYENVKKAIDKALEKDKCSMQYINGILRTWCKEGYPKDEPKSEPKAAASAYKDFEFD